MNKEKERGIAKDNSEGMKTKEAIEVFLDNVVRTLLLDEVGVYNNRGRDNVNKKVNRVIDLLKRGEKFEKMWGELENKDLAYDNDSPVVNDAMYYIKQKYFPKPKKEGALEQLEYMLTITPEGFPTPIHRALVLILMELKELKEGKK